jgi:hypothetical protein
MTDQSLDTIRRGGERLMEEVAREEHLAHAGFKDSAELQPIYARHGDVLGPDALAATLEAFRGTEAGSEAHRSARALLEWEAEAGAARVVAPLEERQIVWEATAAVRQPDGTRVPYSGVSIAIANATDRRERLALDEANESVARMQLEVADLRFGKGLTDNFFVVDAEGLYNSARVSLLTSRQQVLLDELQLLSEAGLLRPEAFLPPPPATP